MKKCEYKLEIECSSLDCSGECIEKENKIKELMEKHKEILKLEV